MANMENRIDSFIAENGLDENTKDAVIELVNGCFSDYVGHMAKEWLANPVANKTKSSTSMKSKKDKLDDPTQADDLESLMNCTTATLNEYCKNHGLKSGGNKTEISGRVWRHLQGDSLDDDMSSKTKTKDSSVTKNSKDSKAKKEIHTCFACNSKGAPCGINATEEYNGHWFCFHHIDNAEELLDSKKDSGSDSESKAPKAAKTPKTPKTSKTPKTPSKKKGGKSKKSSESESEHEQEEELNSE